MHSIRARVGIATLVGVLAIAGAASATWYLMAARVLREDLDVRIDSSLRTLATLTHWTTEGIELEFSDELMPSFLPGADTAYFQVWRADGSVVERSRSLDGEDLVPGADSKADGSPWDQSLPNGDAGRAMMLEFPVTEGFELRAGSTPYPSARIMVARSREALDSRLGQLRRAVLWVGIGLAAAAGLLAYFVATIGLRPVRKLSEDVEGIDPNSLPRSLANHGLPVELATIHRGLNALIHRIRDTVAREQRVAANIAHELRTPVSELLSVTEIALRWPDDDGFRDRALRSSHGIARRMRALTDTVLRLAQAESSTTPIPTDWIQLEPLLRGIWDASVDTMTADDSPLAQRATLQTVPEARVRSDPTSLHIILANLIENALEHGDPGQPVHCALVQVGGDVELRITNGASALDRADVTHFGERFWRKDPTRTPGARTHLGLGLTMTVQLCERAGWALTYQLESGVLTTRLQIRVRGLPDG